MERPLLEKENVKEMAETEGAPVGRAEFLPSAPGLCPTRRW